MAEVPSDDSDVYPDSGGGGCDESNTSATSGDHRTSSASRESCFSPSAEALSECNEEVDDLGSTDSSVFLDPRRSTDVQDSDEAFNLDIAGDSDSDVHVGPISDEEDEEDIMNIPSPGDFASLLKETHFRLICNGSNTVFIEAMVLIFQFTLK